MFFRFFLLWENWGSGMQFNYVLHLTLFFLVSSFPHLVKIELIRSTVFSSSSYLPFWFIYTIGSISITLIPFDMLFLSFWLKILLRNWVCNDGSFLFFKQMGWNEGDAFCLVGRVAIVPYSSHWRDRDFSCCRYRVNRPILALLWASRSVYSQLKI